MTEIISNINELSLLLGSLVSFVSAAFGLYFAIKNWIALIKTKESAEIWSLIVEIADNAIKEAEASKLSGEDKKNMVIKAVVAGAEAAGLDISAFLTRLDLYIDQTIDFVNKMKDAKN